jgi:hypothetical protein
MPFKAQVFQENVQSQVEGSAKDELLRACEMYAELTTPLQKAQCIHDIMVVLDRELDAETRRKIMESCGRQCIGVSSLKKARRFEREARNLDDLLARLNEAHIGGGHLRREGNVIQATYDRCYCGSVSKTKELFSATYCNCSCGWYRQLFETLLGKPILVELISSIIQGDERCQFLIHIHGSR